MAQQELTGAKKTRPVLKESSRTRLADSISCYCAGRPTIGIRAVSSWACGRTGLAVQKCPIVERHISFAVVAAPIRCCCTQSTSSHIDTGPSTTRNTARLASQGRPCVVRARATTTAVMIARRGAPRTPICICPSIDRAGTRAFFTTQQASGAVGYLINTGRIANPIRFLVTATRQSSARRADWGALLA